MFLLGQGRLSGIVGLCGFYSGCCGKEHIVAGTRDGKVRDVSFQRGGPAITGDVVATVPGLTCLSSYLVPGDTYRHIIAGTDQGSIVRLCYEAEGTPRFHPSILTEVPDLASVAGYFLPGTRKRRHIIIATTTSGELHRLIFGPGRRPSVRRSRLTGVPGLVGVAGYVSDGDEVQHVVVAIAGGDIVGMSFTGRGGDISEALLGNLPGTVSVAAYYAATDGYQHVIVADESGTIHELYFHDPQTQIGHDVIARVPDPVSVTAYMSAGDGYQHAVAASSDGSIAQSYFSGATATHAAEATRTLCDELAPYGPLTVPVPPNGLDVGTYDCQTNLLTLRTAHPFYTVVHIEPPGEGLLHPVRVVVHHVVGYLFLPYVTVTLTNNTAGVSMTVNTQTPVAALPGQTSVTAYGPFTQSVGISMQHGATGTGDTLIIDPPLRLEAGCIIVPALPVAVVYQPPLATGSSTFTTEETTGIALTKMTAAQLPNAHVGDLSAVAGVLGALGDFLSALGAVVGLYGEEAQVISGRLGAVGSSITAAKDVSDFIPGATGTWGFTVSTSDSVEVTAAIGQSWSSVKELGAGAGDVILYLKDVRFVVIQTTFPDPQTHEDVNSTHIAPVSFSGDGPQDVLASRLLPGAEHPPDLPEKVRKFLLSWDPVARGDPDQIAEGARYVFVENFAEGNEGVPRRLFWSYTVDQQYVAELHSIPTDGDEVQGSIASNYRRKGKTLTAAVDAVGPFNIDVYYDQVFGTFAFHTPPPIA
jgi:hypothetical protein